MSLIYALLAQAAVAEPVKTIIVIAPRTRQELAECLARRCPVREDAIASIHHAQAQFAQGSYPDARKTLLASLQRNRKATDEDPRAVSALWHALARVTLHNGDMREYRRAALRSGSILARSEKVTPPERVRGEVQMADALTMTGDVEGGVRGYRAIGEKARADGDVELAQIMALRSVFARSGFDGKPAARRALERSAQDETLTPRARTLALSLAAQLQGRMTAKTEALLDAVPEQSADAAATLIYAPANRLSEQREAIARAVANNDSTLLNMMLPRSGEARRYSWADIGFWIRPDGRVDRVEILRGSPRQSWASDAIKSVGQRRYAAFAAAAASEGRYKIERVTLTYDHVTPAGSLIRRRGGLPIYRFEELKIEQDGRAP